MSDTPTNHPALPAPSSPTTTHPAVTPSTASSTQSGTPLPPAYEDKSRVQPPPLPLPAPSAEETTSLELNGAAVSLADKLGPAVIHADGTMSRIANWASMTEAERRNTLRVLGKRNKLRLEALRDTDSQDESDKGNN